MFRLRCTALVRMTSSRLSSSSSSSSSSSGQGKAALPLRESMSLDDGKAGKLLVPAFVVGTLALGCYLHSHDYMHQRETVGVVQATPGPLRGLTKAVRDNVPGAYENAK